MEQCSILEHNTLKPALSKTPQPIWLSNVFHFETLDEKQL